MEGENLEKGKKAVNEIICEYKFVEPENPNQLDRAFDILFEEVVKNREKKSTASIRQK